MVIFYVNQQGEYYYQRAFINAPTHYDVSWWIVPGTVPNGI